MAKEQLSDKQQQILEFIKRRILDKGYPPGDFGEKRIHS